MRDYDYTIAGSYFVTICSFDMRCVFGSMRDAKVELSALGRLVRQVWLDIPTHFAGIELDEMIVMPNHLHGVLTNRSGSFRGAVDNVERYAKPVTGSLPTVVRSFKSATTKRAREEGLWGVGPLWQRGYYDHVVRSGEALKEIRWYIQQNPQRWL